jgi:RNA polymerase-binding transcription factor DksA
MHISTDALNRFRKRLRARREELGARLIRIGSDQRRDAEPLSPDAPDRAIQRENDDVIDCLGIAADAELAEVEAALARIGQGRFGVCESCGYPIEARRLETLPHARRCLSCTAAPAVRSSAA